LTYYDHSASLILEMKLSRLCILLRLTLYIYSAGQVFIFVYVKEIIFPSFRWSGEVRSKVTMKANISY